MLAGIGGRTIAEAQWRMSWQEFQAWMEYREKHGPLHLLGRLEHGFALVAHTVAGTVPRKPGARALKFEDFLPKRPKAVDSADPISLEKAMEDWR